MPSQLWQAPVSTAPVEATVPLPGSKSVTNRALLLAALADGPGVVRQALRSRDADLMVTALRTLGTELETEGADYRVTPGPIVPGGRINVGLAGTVMRFVPPMAALADGEVFFDGDPHAGKRPMAPILDGLRALGARIDNDALPFTIRGPLTGGEVTLDASGSSQFVSGLLLTAPRFEKAVTIRHVGPPVPSQPHIRMTVQMLRSAGVTVDDGEQDVWRVEPGPIAARDLTVEPDLSNAAPFLAAAMVTGGTVTIPGWPSETTQGGDALRDLLTQMGANVTLSSDASPGRALSSGAASGSASSSGALTLTASGEISGIDADLRDVSELTPTIAALAAFATSPTTIRGVAHIRGHETDRLNALVTEINRLGGDAEETEDGLTVRPRKLHGGVFHSYDDHRMATAGAVIGLVVPGVEVENIATTGKTLPEFARMWAEMLGAGR